jgi:hypothetical protein
MIDSALSGKIGPLAQCRKTTSTPHVLHAEREGRHAIGLVLRVALRLTGRNIQLRVSIETYSMNGHCSVVHGLVAFLCLSAPLSERLGASDSEQLYINKCYFHTRSHPSRARDQSVDVQASHNLGETTSAPNEATSDTWRGGLDLL